MAGRCYIDEQGSLSTKMTINTRLELRQGQTLTMTPQLQQAIKLLQMSNLELSEFIEAEIEKNPLLERDDSLTSERPDLPSDQAGGDQTGDNADSGDERAATGSLEEAYDSSYSDEGRGDSAMADHAGGYDAFATNSFADVGKGGSTKFDDSDFSLENTMAQETSLRDHLLEQIQLEFDTPGDRAIASVLLDYLDESGYIRADLVALAERLGTTAARVEGVLAVLQQMDPAGLFARNLSECLALQLREQNRLDPAMQKMLANLELLASHDLKKLREICAVDDADLKDMISEIRSLNPKPGLAFDSLVVQTVIPDVLMRPLPKSKGGGWAVELNNDTLPRVLINKTYYTEVNNTSKDKQAKTFLSDQMAQASWLVKALDQRAQTILKVAGAIIESQEAFFTYGVEYLKPMALKDVAATIGMHESTVSRVTTSKYLGTPRGVFELKYFFSSGVGSTDGQGSFSAEAIKARIKALTEAEPADAILSDDDLVDLLKKDGIEIARRTVAKYREAQKIPSSVQRRRIKSLRA